MAVNLNTVKNAFHKSMVMEIFESDVKDAIASGEDFCLARIVCHEGKYYFDHHMFWSWGETSHKDIESGFKDATYDEVEKYGEGYYLFTTTTDYETHYEPGYGVSYEYWTYPNVFLKYASFDEMGETDEL